MSFQDALSPREAGASGILVGLWLVPALVCVRLGTFDCLSVGGLADVRLYVAATGSLGDDRCRHDNSHVFPSFLGKLDFRVFSCDGVVSDERVFRFPRWSWRRGIVIGGRRMLGENSPGIGNSVVLFQTGHRFWVTSCTSRGQ